jgi:hypothetical protein
MRYSGIVLLTLSVILTSNLRASEGVDDVMKLASAGISQDVMLAFVQNSGAMYDPSADEIQQMRSAGVSATVIVAMIDHDKTARKSDTPDSSETAANDTQAIPEPAIDRIPEDRTDASNNNVEPATDVSYAAPDYADDSNASTIVYAPPEEDTNISFFYEALSPHGKWHRSESAGWVWQPSVVSVRSDWRPYANDGHWLWSDQGWYWQSTYSWGWAPFHYGRWHNDTQFGWVWAPDTEWAPAWVSWRHGDDYYGWAPLPPESRFEAGVGFHYRDRNVGFNFDFLLGDRDYTFVSSRDFMETDLHRVAISRSRANQVFNQTTIINNTYVYNDNRVINNGVPYNQVAQRSNRRIETVHISDARYSAGTAIRGEVRERDSIRVYRPSIKRSIPVDPPTAIARSANVRVRPVNARYQRVTNNSERAAQARLTSEITRRKTPGYSSRGNERAEPAQHREAARQETEHRKDDRKEDAEKRENDRIETSNRAREEAAVRTKAREETAAHAREEESQRKLDRELEKREREQAKPNRVEKQKEEPRRAEPKEKGRDKGKDDKDDKNSKKSSKRD